MGHLLDEIDHLGGSSTPEVGLHQGMVRILTMSTVTREIGYSATITHRCEASCQRHHPTCMFTEAVDQDQLAMADTLSRRDSPVPKGTAAKLQEWFA